MVSYKKLGFVNTREMFKKAMKELETSICQTSSSKAMFYLKRATAGFWSVTQKDIKPPVVWIDNDAIDRWEDRVIDIRRDLLHRHGHHATAGVVVELAGAGLGCYAAPRGDLDAHRRTAGGADR